MYRAQLYCIIIFLIFAAFLQIPDVEQYDSKRILQLIALTIIGVLFFFSAIRRIVHPADHTRIKKITTSTCTFTTLAILVIAGLTSVILSDNYQYALLEFSFLFLLLTLVILIAPLTQRRHYVLGRLIIVTAFIFSTLYITIFIGNYISSFFNPMMIPWPDKYDFTVIINGVDVAGKEVLYFDHRRFFNHTQTWSLPILLGLLTYYKGIKNHKLIAVALTFLISCWWMLIFASGGRGSIAGITVALILILIVWKKDAFQLFKNGAITITLGGLLYVIFFRFMITDSGGIPFLRDTDSGRFSMWEKAIEMWMQNPFFGAGPMHYAKFTVEPYFAHPHNFYFQILSEWGLIGFIAFAILGLIFIKMVYQKYYNFERSSSNQTIYLAFTWSILAAFIHAFFSGVMMTPMSQIWFVLLAAWFIGYKRYDYSIQQPLKGFKYLHTVYLVFLVIVLWLVFEDVLNLTEIYAEYASTYPGSVLFPRFWGQGLFE